MQFLIMEMSKEYVKAEHPSSAVTRSGIGCNALLGCRQTNGECIESHAKKDADRTSHPGALGG